MEKGFIIYISYVKQINPNNEHNNSKHSWLFSITKRKYSVWEKTSIHIKIFFHTYVYLYVHIYIYLHVRIRVQHICIHNIDILTYNAFMYIYKFIYTYLDITWLYINIRLIRGIKRCVYVKMYIWIHKSYVYYLCISVVFVYKYARNTYTYVNTAVCIDIDMHPYHEKPR
jgi:hypothetical protein